MCQLAYRGIEENKATFTDTDLAILSIPKEISNIGLLQAVSSIISDGHLVYYSFLHLHVYSRATSSNPHLSHVSQAANFCVPEAVW